MKKRFHLPKHYVRSIAISLAIIFTVLFTLSSCAKANEGFYAGDAADNSFKDDVKLESDFYLDSYDKEQSKPVPEDGVYDETMSSSSSVGNIPENRKIIKNVNIRSETKEFEKAIERIETLISESKGYIQSSDRYGKSLNSFGISQRNARFVLRIPAENLDLFLSEVEGVINVVSNSETVDDITNSYTDTEARLNSLKTSEARLLELLKKAGTLTEVIQLEEKLSDIRYQIESYTATLRNYDTLVAYSTVTLSIDEVVDYTSAPIVNPTFGERLSKAFYESWNDFADGVKNFAVGFVYAAPSLIVTLLVILLIVLVVVFSVKAVKKRQKAKFNQNINSDYNN